MRKIPESSSVLSSTPVQSDQPRLHWIGTSESSTCLWPETLTTGSFEGSGNYRGKLLEEFEWAIAEAKSRVWIADPHFDGSCGYIHILAALLLAQESLKAIQPQKVLDVRILTGRFKELKEWQEEQNLYRQQMQIQYRSLDDRLLHDRYALVDNELWHFGSTVGGGFSKLSSASQGWFTIAGDFGILFKNWWEKVV